MVNATSVDNNIVLLHDGCNITTNILFGNISTHIIIFSFQDNVEITLQVGDKISYPLTLYHGTNTFFYKLRFHHVTYDSSYNKIESNDYPMLYYIHYDKKIITNILPLTHVKIVMNIWHNKLALINKVNNIFVN